MPGLYDELRNLAAAKLAHERPGQTLQPTALVHEAWLRIESRPHHPWNCRRHFFSAFAETMTFVKDFWNVPIFGELLLVSQTELGQYIIEGEGTAEEAMNSIAEQHHEILLDAGLIEE